MAAVADRVIVELEAKLDKYNANVRAAEQRFNAATASIQKNARQMETSITRSSAGAGSAIRALAATFAAAFSAQKIAQLADSYTRFTNQLAVAGVTGQRLATVQKELFAIGQRYGQDLETLGTLYGRTQQAAAELGATQGDLIKLTTAVAAGLKIQGSSAQESRGALIQLTQALGGEIVRAEEFNSINEGARPILAAVAQNIDRFGGSVAKLRREVVDGKVTSQEFFQALVQGSDKMVEQADKVQLTIGNSFTVLNNALGAYIGQTDNALSATERVSQAIILLSENLDTVAAALGVIGAVLLGRYVSGMVAATAATWATATAAGGASTALGTLAVVARGAGASLLTAFGGPVGIAVAALAVGIYYLSTRTEEGAQASAQYAQAQEQLRGVQDAATDATDRLAVATGKARAEAIANARAVQQETIQYIAMARAAVIAAKAKYAEAQASARSEVQRASRTVRGVGGPDNLAGAASRGSQNVAQARVDLQQATANLQGATKTLNEINAALAAPPPVRAPGAPGKTPKTKKAPKGSKGPKGTDPEDVARRFEDDLQRGAMDYEQAVTDLIGTVDAREGFERKRIEHERQMNARAIMADDNYSEAQKQKLLLLNDQIAAARMEAQRAAENERLNADSLALAQANNENERDLLERMGRLATTTAERRDIELRLLDLQYQEERLRLEAIVNNQRLNEAEREIARRRLAALDGMYAADREGVERQYEGAGARYMRELNSKDINEQLDEVRVRGLQALEDKLVDVTAKIFKMGGAFGEVANQIIADLIRIGIQRAIIGPLANALFGGGAGGGLGGLLGGILGGSVPSNPPIVGPRASGGHVSAGKLYRVNETGVEGFQPGGSGKIIPLGRMHAAGGGGTVVQQTFVLDARYGITTPELLRHVDTVAKRSAAQAGAASFQAGQKAMPGTLAKFQKLGTTS